MLRRKGGEMGGMIAADVDERMRRRRRGFGGSLLVDGGL
jgi:hypothetical protein